MHLVWIKEVTDCNNAWSGSFKIGESCSEGILCARYRAYKILHTECYFVQSALCECIMKLHHVSCLSACLPLKLLPRDLNVWCVQAVGLSLPVAVWISITWLDEHLSCEWVSDLWDKTFGATDIVWCLVILSVLHNENVDSGMKYTVYEHNTSEWISKKQCNKHATYLVIGRSISYCLVDGATSLYNSNQDQSRNAANDNV